MKKKERVTEKLKKNGQPSRQGEGGGRPKIWTTEVIEALADEFMAFMKVDKHYWFKLFAIQKGIPASYLADFAQTNEKFSEALKRAHDIQEYRLVRWGMRHPGAMAIFALKNTEGWRDQSNIAHSGTLTLQTFKVGEQRIDF